MSTKSQTSPTHPATELRRLSEDWGLDPDSAEFAAKLDQEDPLKSLRNEFHYPLKKYLPGIDLELLEDEDEECIYMCSNSLGLMPKCLKDLYDTQLRQWAQLGVFGHENGFMSWAHGDECVDEDMAKLVGAKRVEVTLMNGLTVNQHFLMISFYRPTPTRHKILLEKHAFPSDHYVVESQIRLHGYDPEDSRILLEPRKGEELLRQEDILRTIDEEGDEIALIMLPGVQYYTGQVFDMETITKHGHAKGCYVAFDLAHAVGNIELSLHDWGVDFAVWCTYKYLSSGAGGVGGAFLHEKYKNNDFPKLLGWWGHEKNTRFNMDNVMKLSEGADGYRTSNPSFHTCTALRASLDVYMKTSLGELRTKSRLLTGYLEFLLQKRLAQNEAGKPYVSVITPSDPDERGCQLSLKVSVPVRRAFGELTRRGVVVDLREPNVLRVAPIPMSNTFMDVYKFVDLLDKSLNDAGANGDTELNNDS